MNRCWLPSTRSSGIHSMLFSTWIIKISIHRLCLKLKHLKLQPHLQGTISGRRYNDIIMSAMASQITSVSIRLFAQQFAQGQMKEDMKAPRHWLLWGPNQPITGGFPSKRANNAENVSTWWRHHDYLKIDEISRFLIVTFESHSIKLIKSNPIYITMTSHERHVVSNNRSFGCLFNSVCEPT